jgi:hypothetical protein
MRVLFATRNDTVKADANLAQQLHALRQHYKGRLRFTDVKEMFLQMRDAN